MKKILLLLVCLYSLSLFAQPSGPAAPSADVYNYSKYADVPPNLFTGAISESIPFGTVSAGPLSHQIGISYYFAGHRPTDIASPVGLGWNLIGGGAITRQVMGVDDFKDGQGWLDTGTDAQVLNAFEKEDAANGIFDTQSDIYSINVGGMNAKFVFDHNGNCHTIPRSDLKVEYVTGTFGSLAIEYYYFLVIDNAGNKYYFGDDANFSYHNERTKFNGQEYTSAWYLYKIETHDDAFSVTLTYEDHDYEYYSLQDCELMKWKDNGGSGTDNSSCPMKAAKVEIEGKVLKKITGLNNSVDFLYSSRNDLQGSAKKLYKIEINNGTFQKDFTFSHSVFVDTNPPSSVPTSSGSLSTTDINNSKYKLRLKSVTPSGGTEALPPYHFDYYRINGATSGTYTCASLLTKAYDTYGFANGALVNNSKDDIVPQSTSATSYGFTISHGSALRDPDYNYSVATGLYKMTLPTGGEIQYEYEGNNYVRTFSKQLLSLYAHSTSCGAYASNNTNLSFTQYEIDNAYLDWFINALTSCGSSSSDIRIRVINVATGDFDYDMTFYGMPDNDDRIYLSTMNLSANTNYNFGIVAHNGVGTAEITMPNAMEEEDIGGVRLKKKTTRADATSPSIIRNFTYDAPQTGLSSGHLYREPLFAYGFSNAAHLGIGNVLFSTSTVRPFTSVQGSHIGYEHALIDYNGNGESAIEYYTDANYTGHSSFPAVPEDITRSKWGQLKESTVKNETGQSLQKTQSYYASSELGVSLGSKNHIVRKVGFRGVSGDTYYSNEYQFRTGTFRPYYTITDREGISTRMDYTYLTGSNPDHLNPTTIATTYPDNTEYSQYMTYTTDIANTAIQAALDDRNIIAPYTQSHRIGTSTTSYSKTEYALFAGHPRPIYTLQRDFKSDGTYSQEKNDILSYNGKGQVTKYRPHGSQHDLTYVYNTAGLLTEMSTTGATQLLTSYTYHPNSTLLQSKTAIDGTTTQYDYDDMIRLDKVTHPNGATEEWDYNIATDFTSHIKTTQTFPSDANSLSNLTELITEQYLDGLGRTYKTLGRNQTASGANQVRLVEFDSQGRPHKHYETINYNPISGFYQGIPYTETIYEPSPLNRKTQVLPPDGDPGTTDYSYGTNSQTITAADGTSYIAGELFKNRITDDNGNQSISYTDSRGRLILQRRANFNGGQYVDTKYDYDWKDRKIEVIPPASTISMDELNYHYEYTADNKIKRKKVPSKAWIDYVYDERDLLIGMRDGYLSGQNKWYAYNYDIYGREVASGFSSTQPTTANSTLSTQLTGTEYGITGTEKGNVIKSKIKVLGAAGLLESDIDYDSYGRMSMITSDNHLNQGNDHDVTEFFYDGANNVVRTTSSIINAQQSTLTIDNTTIIDDDGRTTAERIKIDNLAEKLLCSMAYDDEDQLSIKYLGGDATTHLQKVDYSYLVSGMLEGVNINKTADDLYGYHMYYDEVIPSAPTNVTQQYNGNISGVKWQQTGLSDMTTTYSYDYLDRLTHSYTPSNQYNTSYTYDDRGNFNTVSRHKAGTHVDDLTYNYQTSNTNKLLEIVDAADAANGYEKKNGDDYDYDANGNMTRDPQKGITIAYNHLDLPELITWDDGQTISMTYLADGTLVSRKSTKESITKTQDYIDGVEYLEGYPYIVHHAAGRVVNHGIEQYLNYLYLDHEQSIDGTFRAAKGIESEGMIIDDHTQYYAGQEIVLNAGFQVVPAAGFTADIQTPPTYTADWQYEYDITDHLGNVRMVFSGTNINNLTVTQSTSYYPYGGQYNNTAKSALKSNYLYNGIEKVSDFGLDWDMATYRSLDGMMGRWGQVDPKAELMPGYSPYVAMNNNPISFNDPNGDIVPLVAIAIGAAVGGGFNVYRNWDNITQNGFSLTDFGAAFGIGAVAGGVGVATGGAAAGLVGGGAALTASAGTVIASGAVAGGAGLGVDALIQETGNALYFGDANFGEALGDGLKAGLKGVAIGTVTGGALAGIGVAAGNFTKGTITETTGISGTFYGETGTNSITTTIYGTAEDGFATAANAAGRTVGQTGSKVGNQSLNYHSRVLAQDNLYHNFSTTFDNHIIQNGAWSQRLKDGANWYELPGSINGTDGIYQIGVNGQNTIFHKNFVPWEQYLKF